MTPNWHCRLPGYSYDAPTPTFMTRDEVVAWLAGWLETFEPPLRTHTTVTRLSRIADDRFELTVSGDAGEEVLTCDQVVIATGGYPLPVVPAFASSLDPVVTQIHSEQYRNADQLPEARYSLSGPVSPAHRSPRISISPAARYISRSATLPGSRAPTVDATA